MASSGASFVHSAQAPSTSAARSIGQTSQPAYASVTGKRAISTSVTMPKLPPPPRSAQKSSAFVSGSARTTSPSAVTTSAERTLEDDSPYFRASQPMPPPSE